MQCLIDLWMANLGRYKLETMHSLGLSAPEAGSSFKAFLMRSTIKRFHQTQAMHSLGLLIPEASWLS